ncbi:MAG: anthranilate phosphoribosyltransferase [Candidatus Eremiobacteraeota bacterium]|nr:anthranilate phosphoribosyltransferase [Candidatus Eremiobacteraeota bacterium]
MTGYSALLRRLIAHEDLDAQQTAEAFGAIMDELLSPAQAAALLAALASKGECAAEIVGAARAMRERSLHVDCDREVIDVCGTGGDGAGTINISTAVAFVLAGAGLCVAKHGNRAASSKCGSADVLEALGVRIDIPPEQAARQLAEHNVTFLFAQHYHPAMRAVGPVRRELGVRTIFNMLGPLTNPARARRQVIGVPTERWVTLIGEALMELGADAGAVVHGTNGLDEVAGDVPTRVYQFDRQGVRTWTLIPRDYGISASLEDLRGGDAAFNAAALLSVLGGERSPRADVVALNSALGFVVAGRAASIDEGLEVARHTITEGKALRALDALRGRPQMEFAQ